MQRNLLTVALMAACMVSAGAQTEKPSTQSATHSSMVDPAKAADHVLSSFEKEFVAAAQAMPADKYDFSPDSLHIQGANFATVRTFAQQVTHVAQANYSIYALMMGTKPTVNVKALADLKSKDEILAALTDSFTVAHKAIATLTPENENEAVGSSGMTKGTMALYGAVHGFDHYGQMVEYLRMNGIVPPASAKK